VHCKKNIKEKTAVLTSDLDAGGGQKTEFIFDHDESQDRSR